MPLPSDLIADLRKSISGSLRTDRAARILYSTDASIYQIEPLGVVIPRDGDDLQAIVELASRYKVPILPRGSGSSLAGQAVGQALIVDCSRWLDQIVEINPEERTATVEPGVILASLNKALIRHGLQFGPDPASAERATMGGVIANNATGAHSIQYGMAADHILEADVVLADGSLAHWREEAVLNTEDLQGHSGIMPGIVSSALEIRAHYAEVIRENYPRSWRNSAGYRLNYLLPWSPSQPPQWYGRGAMPAPYPPIQPSTLNLAPLLAGSEGTLAVIRRAKVNLVAKPKQTVLAVLAYRTIAAACDDVPRLLSFQPSAIELIPQSIVRLARSVPAYAIQASFLDLNAEALLVVEFSGDKAEILRNAAAALRPALMAETAEDQARVWSVRKVGLGLLASRPGDAKTVAFIEDCAIPVDQLGAFVRGIERILADYGVQAEYYAHASAGCLHIRPILDLKRQVHSLRGIAEATLALTLSLGGSMSSEHGDGLARSEWLHKTYGEAVLAAFRLLKQAADPAGILSPRKIVDAPPMDTNLRFGGDYSVQVWEPRLDFTREGGLAGAIEQCNGQGVCRKLDGVMCPSFQATREEMHSTRGRANMLRAMISNPPAGLQEDAFAALDLCLACKGCKSECPSGVDMAKLKYSFQAEYYRTHRRALRDYLFGYFDLTAALLAPIAPLANAVMQLPPARSAIARVTGITSRRPFPRFSSKGAHVREVSRTAHHQKILFLTDPLTHYLEPRIEQAAFDVLSRIGFDVVPLPLVGAGTALLSKGFIDAARRHAGRMLDGIAALDPGFSLPVTGLEPPEVYTLKNEYGGLLPGRADEIRDLTRRVWLLDEFLLRADEFDALRIAIRGKVEALEQKPRLKFQPHCHQRAEPPAADGLPSGAVATVQLLRSCGFEVELIDSGCCGMAGTFGYEAEHYEVSMAVGGLKLFPAIARFQKETQAVLIATGTACRWQIEQGTPMAAEHSIVYLARYF